MRAAQSQGLITDSPIGLYMHFPWCAKKCPYCDFNSHPVSGEIPEREYVPRQRKNAGLAAFIQLGFWVLGGKAHSWSAPALI